MFRVKSICMYIYQDIPSDAGSPPQPPAPNRWTQRLSAERDFDQRGLGTCTQPTRTQTAPLRGEVSTAEHVPFPPSKAPPPQQPESFLVDNRPHRSTALPPTPLLVHLLPCTTSAHTLRTKPRLRVRHGGRLGKMVLGRYQHRSEPAQ